MEKMGVSCKKIMSLLKVETVLANVTFSLFSGRNTAWFGLLISIFLAFNGFFRGGRVANPKFVSLHSFGFAPLTTLKKPYAWDIVSIFGNLK